MQTRVNSAEEMMGKYQKSSGKTETKKAWLKRARNIQHEIWALEDAQEAAFEAATAITPKYAPSSGGGSKDPHKIEGYALLQAYKEDLRRELKKLQPEILDAIKTLPKPESRSILIHYYINCREWPEVSALLHISERHVHRLHGEALQAIRIDAASLAKVKRQTKKHEQIIKS